MINLVNSLCFMQKLHTKSKIVFKSFVLLQNTLKNGWKMIVLKMVCIRPTITKLKESVESDSQIH